MSHKFLEDYDEFGDNTKRKSYKYKKKKKNERKPKKQSDYRRKSKKGEKWL